jgi:hypothetical protein
MNWQMQIEEKTAADATLPPSLSIAEYPDGIGLI